MKVMTIVGTRPEIIKLSRVIPELDKHVDHVLVHTGQNLDYQLSEVFFKELGIRPVDEQLDCTMNTTLGTIGNILNRVDGALDRHKPDAVLVLGDTNSALSVYAAKRRHIPIFHMEAGNRCFDDRTPEEVNRRIVDTIADVNMPYTEHARRNLLASGCPADRIIKTGSPMREVLTYYREQICCSHAIRDFRLTAGAYYVVSAHREENVDQPDRLKALVLLVNDLAQRAPVVFSVHPRTRQRLTERKFIFFSNVKLSTPLGFFDYVQMQKNALCVISDSGTITEESAMLHFPAVMLRQAQERPEGMDEGAVIMADFPGALKAIELAIEAPIRPYVPDYDSENVSKKIVRTIVGYTDYVRRTVWRQS